MAACLPRGGPFPVLDPDVVPGAGDLSAGELFEGGTGPPWWQARWAALSRAVAGSSRGSPCSSCSAGAAVFVRNWSAERELRQAVELTATFGVWSSSTSPPGGEVGYFLLVRNDGPPARVR